MIRVPIYHNIDNQAFNIFRTKKRSESLQNPVLTTSTPDKFGLITLIEPTPSPEPSSSALNIVFVHGLGGSAYGTWTDEKTNSFWPSWLIKVKGLENARIMTFGYDSNWKKIWKSNNVLDISDFARQLVNDLWCHYEDYGDVRQQMLGFFNVSRRILSLLLIVWAVL
jgi:hypothetical protein